MMGITALTKTKANKQKNNGAMATVLVLLFKGWIELPSDNW